MSCLFNSIVPNRLSHLWQDDDSNDDDTNGRTMPQMGVWNGETKILIGIDIGTTYSGVSFAFLQKGSDQVIHRVTRWPGQEAHQQQSKIPTLIWYDTNQKAVAFGAEAQLDEVEEQAEDECWSLAKHFKLHLHPDDLKAKHDLKLDGKSLPPGVNLEQIYSDFLRYLLKHTKAYFEDRVLDGKYIWERYSPKMEVVVAHPNGWGLREQQFLRSATIAAGLAGEDTASSKVRFVTEAEASVHFCIHHANVKNVLKPGTSFGVCDAGGSTVDSTMYMVVSESPLKIKEQRDSGCVQAGAIFVDYEMEKYLENTLQKAELDAEDIEFYTKTGVKDFESYAKRTFRSKTAEYTVLVADSRFNKPKIETRRGRMIVHGSTIQRFFDKCITEIKQSVDQQMAGLNVPHLILVGGFGENGYVRNELKKHYEPRGSKLVLSNESSSTIQRFFDKCITEIKQSVDQQMAGLNVPHLILVGGFGENGYVRNELKKHYEPRGSKLVLSNESSAKAVADGAVIWGASCSVVSRVPRYSFGVQVQIKYRPLIDDPAGRKPYTTLAGKVRVNGGWSEIVHKGEAIDCETIHRRYYQALLDDSTPRSFLVSLVVYSGDDTPEWLKDPRGKYLDGFRSVCTLTANLKDTQDAMVMLTNPSGSKYWTLDFSVCICFSGTELKSFLEWKENGVQQTGPVSIILPKESGLD
ncbi:unnamed protein product [Rhizoctonia solani]|uniref:Heat shock 70 kDa protein 12A n=1 Tax=Rhizoctonia solani TaxID=456999 RepID=A0A8H3A8C6_9AGAM|nr:unnamed protein product [Rhizoctonia solani]